jgi:host factor-I protein
VRSRKKPPPPGETGQEALYLKFLSEKQVPVTVKLRDGEQVQGWIEYFDDLMIRLTREGKPNLFIYKNQVRTISETAHRNDRRRDPKAPGKSKAVAIVDVAEVDADKLDPENVVLDKVDS